MSEKNKCTAKTEVYSRVCGFFRPVQQWNKGKKEEFKERRNFVIKEKEHLKKSWPARMLYAGIECLNAHSTSPNQNAATSKVNR